MLDNNIEDLFGTIEGSDEYIEYKKIGNILKEDPKVLTLLQEIKDLQKEAVYLEEQNDIRYKEVDNIIVTKVEELNQNKVYQEYLEKMKKFNEIILKSSNILETYVNDKI